MCSFAPSTKDNGIDGPGYLGLPMESASGHPPAVDIVTNPTSNRGTFLPQGPYLEDDGRTHFPWTANIPINPQSVQFNAEASSSVQCCPGTRLFFPPNMDVQAYPAGPHPLMQSPLNLDIDGQAQIPHPENVISGIRYEDFLGPVTGFSGPICPMSFPWFNLVRRLCIVCPGNTYLT